MKKILITGGAGFIGSHIAERLIQRGDFVIVVDNLNDYYDPKLKLDNIRILNETNANSVSDLFKFAHIDICDKQSLEELFQKYNFEVVCHMAARAGVRHSFSIPQKYIETNVIGTINLLQLSVNYNVKNFVFASSSSVYGERTGVLSENNSNASNGCNVECVISPYAATKLSCEKIAYVYSNAYKLNVSALRFFTVYGPRGRPDMAPFKFVDSIYKGIIIERYGNGTTKRDYTFIDDIVNGAIRAIDTPLAFEIVNLGNSDPICLSDFIHLIEDILGKKAIIIEKPMEPGDVTSTFADISKAKALYGYEPKTSIQEGMKRLISWYLSKFEQ